MYIKFYLQLVPPKGIFFLKWGLSANGEDSDGARRKWVMTSLDTAHVMYSGFIRRKGIKVIRRRGCNDDGRTLELEKVWRGRRSRVVEQGDDVGTGVPGVGPQYGIAVKRGGRRGGGVRRRVEERVGAPKDDTVVEVPANHKGAKYFTLLCDRVPAIWGNSGAPVSGAKIKMD